MGFRCAPGVQPALLQVARETKTFLLGAAASRYRAFDPRRAKRRLHLFDAKFRVHGLADVGLAGSDKDGDDEKAGERAGTFKRGDIYKMHAYRDAIPDARSVWILYPGGEFRFFGVPGSRGQSGSQAVSSLEGLPDELEGVGAIPLGPVVGDKPSGGGRREAVTSDDLLRETLRRMFGGGSGMSTTPYIS